jgi:flagellar hook-associated protein 3 FlgL
MSTRITNNMLSRSVLSDLNDIATKQAQTRRQMSSGKEITKPSDDPYAAGRAISLRGELEGITQHARNVQEAQGWMTVTETALSQITDMGQTARELTVQGATDTLPQTSRNAIADQIDQLIAGIKQEATDPGVTPNDAYAGDTATQLREIGPSVTLAVNVHGDEVLGGASGASGNLLGVLRDISTHLRSGDTATLGTDDLTAITDQVDNVVAVRARVGAGMNRLDTASSRLQEMEESTMSMLSNTEDADMAQTLVNFSTQQAVYQSALNAGARIVQTSLLDFLH